MVAEHGEERLILLSCDPGNIQSAFCLYNTVKKLPIEFCTLQNDEVLLISAFRRAKAFVIEKVACYGMPVGETVFETVYWSGRFAEQWDTDWTSANSFARITRQEVKLHLCGQARAKDANVRQALIDRFGEKGTVKNKGVLYGIKADEWQALAVAVAYSEIHKI